MPGQKRIDEGGAMVLGQEVILETHALVKAFKGFVAVDGVSMRVRRGEIHALIGPNGAGKTTFFNLLTKFLQPTSGDIFYRGRNITRENPADVARRGIVRSFQICAVFPHLTVLENVRVALQRQPQYVVLFLAFRKNPSRASTAGQLPGRGAPRNVGPHAGGRPVHGRKRASSLPPRWPSSRS